MGWISDIGSLSAPIAIVVIAVALAILLKDIYLR
ncbi:UNVERIFIED_ORG: hypothetical protein GGI66_003600 [Rhizobium esperanzae]